MDPGSVQDKTVNNSGLPDDVWNIVADAPRLFATRANQGVEARGDPDFDRLTALAASLLDAPVALVSLVDTERQWFKSCYGIDIGETPVGISFCAHAIAAGSQTMVVTDATADPRFAGNPLVTEDHHVRFYVGAPIVVADERIGTLCVLDRVARPHPTPLQVKQLEMLAALAAGLFILKENTRTGALAREALAHEEKRRAVALAAASLASWVWDVPNDRLECDEVLPTLFGYAPSASMMAQQVFGAIDRRDINQTEARFREALASNDDYFGEYRINGFDPPRWLAARGRVIERDAAGKPLLVFGVNYDITERKSADERQRLLLRELNHRVKNTLATVQALATQTVRHASEPQQFLEAFSSRLQALGAAHGLLSDNEWRGIALRELIRLEVMPFDDGDPPRIRAEGRDIFLTPDQALGLGLVLHELASNALKYGALSAASGVVDFAWKIEDEDDARKLVLTWTESGGPPVEQPTRHGFGSILIRRSLAKVLASEVRHEFRPGGVFAEISLPLDASSV